MSITAERRRQRNISILCRFPHLFVDDKIAGDEAPEPHPDDQRLNAQRG
jgi:hypothetical protein